MRPSFERTTHAGVALSLVVLLVVALFAYRANQSLTVASELVVNTQAVLVRLEGVLGAVAKAEAGMSGYVVTGDEIFLQTYQLSLDRLNALLKELRPLIADSPGQQAKWEAILSALEERKAGIDRIILVWRERGFSAASALIAQGDGLRGMNDVRAAVSVMQADEDRRLGERLEWVRRDSRNSLVLLTCGLLLTFFFLGAACYFRRRDVGARRAAEQARIYAERIVDTVREPLVIFTPDLRVRSANRSFYQVFKTDQRETVERYLGELGGGQWNLSGLLTALARVAGENVTLEGFEVRRDFTGLGHKVMLLNARQLQSGGNEPPLLLLAIEDITERTLATEALLKSQQMFQQLFENSPDGIILVDRQGRVVRANPQAGIHFGYTMDEINGMELERLLPERFRVRHAKHFAAYFAAPVVRAMGAGLELFGLRKNGSEFPVDIMLSPVEAQEGPRTLAVIRDITERKRVEQMHLQFRALFESLPGLYVVLMPDFTVVGASDAYLTATMTTRETLLGRNLFEVLPDNPTNALSCNSGALRASLEHVLQSKQTDSMAVLRYDIRRPDQSFEERYWSPVNSAVTGADGQIEYLIHRVEDVTEFVLQKRQDEPVEKDPAGLRRRMEQMEGEIFKRAREIEQVNLKLRAANEELEAFSYSVSHDLRAPLRHIDGFADMLQSQAAGRLDEAGRHCLDTICLAAKKMGRLIDDLLSFSRMSRVQMVLRPVNLDTLVGEVRLMLEGEAAGRTIEWRIRPLPEVNCDSAMLRQVLANLLSNAMKYTSHTEHPIIEVGTLDGEPGSTTVYVRDNGAGFDMKYVNKLFGVFQRLHAAREFEGTGVGLAIVRRIIQRHGGRVRAEGKVQQGATFYFTLPRSHTPQA